MKFVHLLAAFAALACATPATAQTRDPAEAMAFFIGCWRGVFDTPEATHDDRCMTPTLNGRYVRDTHVTRGANYWGETLYGYDAEAQSLAYQYYDSTGGGSRGLAQPGEGGGLVFPADRYVGADGRVMTLRSTWRPDGPNAYVAETELQEADGSWRCMMRINYTRARDITSVAP